MGICILGIVRTIAVRVVLRTYLRESAVPSWDINGDDREYGNGCARGGYPTQISTSMGLFGYPFSHGGRSTVLHGKTRVFLQDLLGVKQFLHTRFVGFDHSSYIANVVLCGSKRTCYPHQWIISFSQIALLWGCSSFFRLSQVQSRISVGSLIYSTKYPQSLPTKYPYPGYNRCDSHGRSFTMNPMHALSSMQATADGENNMACL